MMQQQALEMDSRVAFKPSSMLVILALGGHLIEPRLQIFEKSGLVIVHDDRRIRMQHGNQNDSVAKTTLLHRGLYLRRDVHKLALGVCLQRELFVVNFHAQSSSKSKYSNGTRAGLKRRD